MNDEEFHRCVLIIFENVLKTRDDMFTDSLNTIVIAGKRFFSTTNDFQTKYVAQLH